MAFKGLLSNIEQQSKGVAGVVKGGIATVTAKTGIVDADKQKMKPLIAEKAKMYEFIGMEVFDLYVAGKMNLSEIEPFCKKIETLNVEITKLEAEIAQTSNICECGEKLQKEAKFCPSCGKNTAVTSMPQAQATNTVECVCGAAVEQSSLMCMECGRRV